MLSEGDIVFFQFHLHAERQLAIVCLQELSLAEAQAGAVILHAAQPATQPQFCEQLLQPLHISPFSRCVLSQHLGLSDCLFLCCHVVVSVVERGSAVKVSEEEYQNDGLC